MCTANARARHLCSRVTVQRITTRENESSKQIRATQQKKTHTQHTAATDKSTHPTRTYINMNTNATITVCGRSARSYYNGVKGRRWEFKMGTRPTLPVSFLLFICFPYKNVTRLLKKSGGTGRALKSRGGWGRASSCR